MKIAIVDDMPGDAAVLGNAVSASLRDNGLEGDIVMFTDGETFLEMFRPDRFTVIFLDILLGEGKEDGMTIARRIRRMCGSADREEQPIVFVTTESSYALDGYSVYAFDYLVKPVDQKKVADVMRRVLKIGSNPRFIRIKEKRSIKQIPLRNILYVATANRAVEIHTKQGIYKTYMKFEEIKEQLKTDHEFVCCCRGVLVNLDQVKGMEGQDFKLYNGERIPVSRLKRTEMKEAYTNRLFEKVRDNW